MTFFASNISSFRPHLIIFCVLSLLSFGFISAQSPKNSSDDDKIDLKRCWSFPVPDDGVAAISGDGSHIFVASRTGQIISIDAPTGKRDWTSDLGGQVISQLLVFRSKLYIVTNSSDGGDQTTVRALSRETGITVWSGKIAINDKVYLGGNGNGVLAVAHDGTISRFDSENGSLFWSRKINADIITTPIFSENSIIFGSNDKHIYIVDASSGAVRTSAEVPAVPVFVSGSMKNGVIFGGDRGSLTKWSSDAPATSWRFKAGGKVSKAFRTADGILAGSDDNFIYMVSDYNGDVIWKLRLSGRVSNLIVISDRLAAATAVGENEVVVFDLGSGKPVTKLAANTENSIVNKIDSFTSTTIIAANNLDIEYLSLDSCAVGN